MMDAFKDMYDVVVDRRANPQEGSYTCYLFDKGIDKILKKCGEECTEMVIAAKNNDKDELANEINDLLYQRRSFFPAPKSISDVPRSGDKRLRRNADRDRARLQKAAAAGISSEPAVHSARDYPHALGERP